MTGAGVQSAESRTGDGVQSAWSMTGAGVQSAESRTGDGVQSAWSMTGAGVQSAESRTGDGGKWSAVLVGAEELISSGFLFLRRLESEKTRKNYCIPYSIFIY